MASTAPEFRLEDLTLAPMEGYKIEAVCDASTPGKVVMGVVRAAGQYISNDALQLQVETTRGLFSGVLTLAEGQPGIVLWVPGAGQNLNGPAGGIFADLAGELKAAGVSSFRMGYRNPESLQECVLDVLASIAFLKGIGAKEFVLVGNTLGSSVAISVAATQPVVKAVAALINPAEGTELVDKVSPRPILLIHGGQDTRIPYSVTEEIFSRAKDPKEMVIYPNGGYALVECKEELRQKLVLWLMDAFGKVDAYMDALEAIKEDSGEIFRTIPGADGEPARRLVLTREDIVPMDVEGIVSTTGTWLDLRHTPLAAEIVEKGGWQIQEELWAQGPLLVGDVGVTTAGDLKAKYILHAITGGYGRDDEPQSREEIVLETTKNCLLKADELGLKSIALPAIGSGGRGLPPEISARIMVLTIAGHLSGKTSLEKVLLGMVTDATYRAFEAQMKMIPS